MSSRRWLAVALLLGAALALYLPALRAPFFADDYLFLDQARHRALGAVLAMPDPLGNFFRPVSRQLYFWFIAHASAESPLAFHAVNLATFLLLLALAYGVARRIAGTRAAVIATAILALGHAADVPVRWASGSQELLSVAGALAALALYLAGWRVFAALALMIAALSKETVLVLPLIAIAADHRPSESWLASAKRAWPLGAALAVWAALWLAMPDRHSQGRADFHLDLASALAAFAHLGQTIIGLEWRAHEFGHAPTVLPPLIPLALALAAVWIARAVPKRSAPKPSIVSDDSPRRAIAIGVLWTILGTVPVAFVASIWSAYYYVFALCGAAIAIGAMLARAPRWIAITVVAALAIGSSSARSLEEFAITRTPWTGRSHINRFYIERAVAQADRYLASLRRLRPQLPAGSTLFFTGLQSSVAFQSADGPLMRWAYHDESVHSYFLSDFRRARATGRPVFVFQASGDSLLELDQGPDFFPRVGFTLLASDNLEGAHDAFELEHDRDPTTLPGTYWLAWTQWAMGDTASALRTLGRAGITTDAAGADEVRAALAADARGDTARATSIARAAVTHHGLDPAAHGLLADLLLSRDADDVNGPIEAFAARVLAPDEPIMWRRWAMVQTHHQRYLEALRSFERYFALSRGASNDDAEARGWVDSIRGMLSGVVRRVDGPPD